MYTLQVSVGAVMEPLGAGDPTRVLFESAPTPLAWEAAGPTVFPTIDLEGELALTQVAVALNGAASFFSRHSLRRCVGVFADDGAGAVPRGEEARELWCWAHGLPTGGFEVLTRSRAPLMLEVAGEVDVRDAEGGHQERVVRGAPVLVGVGVPAAEVVLEELPPYWLIVSDEIVEALGPHQLYAIAWRSADGEAAQQIAPTASFGAFETQGDLVLTAPEPRPGMGATTVEVELVLVSNLGQYTGDLAAALDFPRVRREAAFSRAVFLPDGEVTPEHVPRAERLLELDAREQPIRWRRVLDTATTTPILLDVDVAAVRAACALLERE